MPPTVTHLHIKPGSRMTMKPLKEFRILSGKGIIGDASFGKSKRQILIVSNQVLTEFSLKPGDIRENIVIDGLDVDALPPGTEIQIGGTRLNISGACEPCSRLDELHEGLQNALRGRRGILARAISSGTIRVGDPVKMYIPE